MIDWAVRAEGIAPLSAAFRKAPAEIRKALTAEMRDVAEPIARDYRAASPGPSARNHGLAASIRVRPTITGARVGSPKLHAPILEFGEKATITGNGRQRAHVRILTKQPALIPAIRRQAPFTARRVEDAMERAFDALMRSQGVTPG